MLVKAALPRTPDMIDDLTDYATLVEDLKNHDPAHRRQAARALRDTPTGALILCYQLEKETDASVRSVLLTALIRMRSETVAQRLMPMLRSENVALRNGVIEALQSMPDEALPELSKLLEDDDSDVRLFAVNIMTSIHHPSTYRLLSLVLSEDVHVNVCLAALDGLSDYAGDDLVPILQAFAARFPAVPLVQHAVTAHVRRSRRPQ